MDLIGQQPLSPGTETTEIGRKLIGFSMFPLFYTGVTFDRFHAKGTVPVFKEWL